MSSLLGFVRLLDGISEVAGKIAAWMFLAVGIFVFFEVFMRYVVNAPTIWVDEVSRIFQVWAAFLSISYVLKHRAHILIDIAFRKQGSLSRKVVDTFAMSVIVFFCVVVV